MKSLKTKVMASLAMLLVAAVMLTSSSFAWYTISTKGELADVKVEMTATDTMEIAVSQYEPGESSLGDAGDQRTWGTTAVYQTATSSVSQVAQYSPDNTLTSTIAEGSICKIWTPQYDATNRLYATLSEAATDSAATYDKTGATPLVLEDNNGNDCAYVYDFWTRSNKYPKVQIEDNGCVFGGGSGDTTGTLTVVFVDVPTGKVLKVWQKGTNPTFSYEATADATNEYYVSHVAVYVYADGNSVLAKDIDSSEQAAGKLPSFDGKFKVTGADS